jgi:hypothetical protein
MRAVCRRRHITRRPFPAVRPAGGLWLAPARETETREERPDLANFLSAGEFADIGIRKFPSLAVWHRNKWPDFTARANATFPGTPPGCMAISPEVIRMKIAGFMRHRQEFAFSFA